MNDRMELKIVSTDEEYAQAMAVRRSVFVDEHKIPPYLEYDGNDHSSTHILALDRGNPAGTMRIRYFNGFVKFERMCVLPAYRKTDLSEQIMRKGMTFAAEKGYDKVYGVCKKELLSRWQRDGFQAIPNVAPVEQNGMTLIPVFCRLPSVEKQITMQTAPEILNAREGEWFTVPSDPADKDLRSSIDQILKRIHGIRRPSKLKFDSSQLRYIPKQKDEY